MKDKIKHLPSEELRGKAKDRKSKILKDSEEHKIIVQLIDVPEEEARIKRAIIERIMRKPRK